jgi:hypothetical protein
VNEERWACEQFGWTIEIFRGEKRIVKLDAAEILYSIERDVDDGLMNILTKYANIICEARNKE